MTRARKKAASSAVSPPELREDHLFYFDGSGIPPQLYPVPKELGTIFRAGVLAEPLQLLTLSGNGLFIGDYPGPSPLRHAWRAKLTSLQEDQFVLGPLRALFVAREQEGCHLVVYNGASGACRTHALPNTPGIWSITLRPDGGLASVLNDRGGLWFYDFESDSLVAGDAPPGLLSFDFVGLSDRVMAGEAPNSGTDSTIVLYGEHQDPGEGVVTQVPMLVRQVRGSPDGQLLGLLGTDLDEDAVLVTDRKLLGKTSTFYRDLKRPLMLRWGKPGLLIGCWRGDERGTMGLASAGIVDAEQLEGPAEEPDKDLRTGERWVAPGWDPSFTPEGKILYVGMFREDLWVIDVERNSLPAPLLGGRKVVLGASDV